MLAGEGRHPATYDFGMSVVLIYRDPLFRTLHSALGETISVLQAKELKIITSMFCFLSWHVKSRQVDLAPAAKEILASYVTLSLMILRRFCELIGHPNTFASSVQPLSREEKRWSTEELTSTIEDSLLICLRNIATTFRCLAGCSDIRTILSLAPDAGHFSLFGFGECVAAIAFRTKELAEAVKGPRQAGELAHRLPDHRNGISFLENSLAFEAGQVARIKATSRGDREELRLLQEIVGQTWQMVDGSLEGYENVPAGGKNVLELSKALHTNQ
ncbi:hypothetical protein M427DRAFT_34654 [Gonapodya prolifera JEL478]|uniref:Uncharacterized protein n=1 Tax=Gonapodya prolifera (strain JEL478) TaxID=1344416 RepID=A0A139A774_GONPJ|nr:hypothetical protein M427DRAFT_34654 [Gonapodya prolifera JEL478]|eukprot:KXS12650.1 hypothetical protein M427DRAFT_34654 [Gonapodya prolifera JEL478]